MADIKKAALALTKAQRAQKIYNDARNQASDAYIGSTVEADSNTDFRRAFAPLVKYTVFMNEFLDYVVNKIIFQTVESKLYQNPLSIFRREGFPLGTDYENNYINPAKARKYAIEVGDTLLNRKKPDVKTQYFRRNREDQYWVTIPEPLLRGAWTSWEQLDDFITGTIRSLYSGNEIDELNLLKTLMVESVNDSIIKTQTVTGYTESEAGAKLLLKAARALSYKFPFPSSDYNNWLAYAQANDISDATPATTWVENGDIVVIIAADHLVNAEVESLAAAFNLNMADFRERIVPIDSFSYTYIDDDNETQTVTNDDIIAIVADRKTYEYRDNLTQASDFYNAAGLYRNHYLTVFQTYGINVCGNAIALMKP